MSFCAVVAIFYSWVHKIATSHCNPFKPFSTIHLPSIQCWYSPCAVPTPWSTYVENAARCNCWKRQSLETCLPSITTTTTSLPHSPFHIPIQALPSAQIITIIRFMTIVWSIIIIQIMRMILLPHMSIWPSSRSATVPQRPFLFAYTIYWTKWTPMVWQMFFRGNPTDDVSGSIDPKTLNCCFLNTFTESPR